MDIINLHRNKYVNFIMFEIFFPIFFKRLIILMLKSERNDIFTRANDPLICCNEAGFFFIIELSN